MTQIDLAREFLQDGRSFLGLARKYGRTVRQIEAAIRSVLQRAGWR